MSSSTRCRVYHLRSRCTTQSTTWTVAKKGWSRQQVVGRARWIGRRGWQTRHIISGSNHKIDVHKIVRVQIRPVSWLCFCDVSFVRDTPKLNSAATLASCRPSALPELPHSLHDSSPLLVRHLRILGFLCVFTLNFQGDQPPWPNS